MRPWIKRGTERWGEMRGNGGSGGDEGGEGGGWGGRGIGEMGEIGRWGDGGERWEPTHVILGGRGDGQWEEFQNSRLREELHLGQGRSHTHLFLVPFPSSSSLCWYLALVVFTNMAFLLPACQCVGLMFLTNSRVPKCSQRTLLKPNLLFKARKYGLPRRRARRRRKWGRGWSSSAQLIWNANTVSTSKGVNPFQNHDVYCRVNHVKLNLSFKKTKRNVRFRKQNTLKGYSFLFMEHVCLIMRSSDLRCSNSTKHWLLWKRTGKI